MRETGRPTEYRPSRQNGENCTQLGKSQGPHREFSPFGGRMRAGQTLPPRHRPGPPGHPTHPLRPFPQVMIHTVMNHSAGGGRRVQFWLVQNFLSPQFKSFLPHMALTPPPAYP